MKSQLDLGSANVMRQWSEEYDCYGVDIVNHHNSERVRVADLNLEPIPYDSDSFDLVTAHDFVEHIYGVMYVPELVERYEYTDDGERSIIYSTRMIRKQPIIEMFGEIWRVLKHDGLCYVSTPEFPGQMSVQDSTHVSFWTGENINYISGDMYGFSKHYNTNMRFEKQFVERHNGHIQFTLRAIKNLPADHPFLLQY